MQAIAMLLHDDPFAKMTRQQRCDARRERRAKFFPRIIDTVHEIVEVPIDKTQRTVPPITPEPPPEIDPIPDWVERQKKIYQPWFSIVDEIDGKDKITIHEIQRAVCQYFNVSRMDLISDRRTWDIVRPRQVGYYLSKMLTPHSLPEIGRRFGGRDHTSALSGIRKIARLRADDANLDADIQAITSSLGGCLA